MNITIDLGKIGEFPMDRLLIIGILVIVCLIIWQFGNILNAIANYLKTKHEITKNQPNDE